METETIAEIGEPPNFYCSERAGRVRVSGGRLGRRVAECRRYAMKAVALTFVLAATTGCSRITSAPDIPAAERDRIVKIAEHAVATNDTWADHATYEVKRIGQGWEVTVWRIEGHDVLGRRLFTPGGFRVIKIDEHGNVTNYYRGH